MPRLILTIDYDPDTVFANAAAGTELQEMVNNFEMTHSEVLEQVITGYLDDGNIVTTVTAKEEPDGTPTQEAQASTPPSTTT